MAGIFLSTKTDFGTVAGPRNLDGSDLVDLPADAGEPVVQEDLSPEDRQKLEDKLQQVQEQYQELLAERRAAIREARQSGQQPGQGNNLQKFQQLRVLEGRRRRLRIP